MIPYDKVTEGYYWGKLTKTKEKVLVTVYGQSPFFRVDIWQPSFGKRGIHVDNVNLDKDPLEFTEKINKEDV